MYQKIADLHQTANLHSGVGGFEGLGGRRGGGPDEFIISGCLAPPPLYKKFSSDFDVSHGPPTGQLRGVWALDPLASYAAESLSLCSQIRIDIS